jgi:SAM-dependent methyltransferase
MPHYDRTDLDGDGKTRSDLPSDYDWSDPRAYVGPPDEYDLFAAMVFNLMTTLGLRQHHRLLDVGCGSLRIGRLLIPYLQAGRYVGVEPNRWLVESGIDGEVGHDLVRIKQPRFEYSASLDGIAEPLALDFAVAQSIFSHCGQDLFRNWLAQIASHLSDTGALVATFLTGDEDYPSNGWVYPECVCYRPSTVESWAHEFGLGFRLLDYAHPRQTWALMAKPGFDSVAVDPNGVPSWNRMMGRLVATGGVRSTPKN